MSKFNNLKTDFESCFSMCDFLTNYLYSFLYEVFVIFVID